MLEVKGLTVAYEGSDAVQDVSFTVAQGEWLMLIGPNGAGKSSLLKAILGQLWPSVRRTAAVCCWRAATPGNGSPRPLRGLWACWRRRMPLAMHSPLRNW